MCQMGDRFCGEGESDGLSEKHMSEAYYWGKSAESLRREENGGNEQEGR